MRYHAIVRGCKYLQICFMLSMNILFMTCEREVSITTISTIPLWSRISIDHTSTESGWKLYLVESCLVCSRGANSCFIVAIFRNFPLQENGGGISFRPFINPPLERKTDVFHLYNYLEMLDLITNTPGWYASSNVWLNLILVSTWYIWLNIWFRFPTTIFLLVVWFTHLLFVYSL